MNDQGQDWRKAPLLTLDIDLDAIARNYLFLKNKLQQGADCAAVVKADAYGLGVAPVTRRLYDANCRHFFVAHMSEALTLRTHLPVNEKDDAQIYVLGGPAGADVKDILKHRLIPVLNTPGDLEYWAEHASGKPAVLHIDTGMNRLGLGTDEARRLADDTALLQKIDLRYVMSHLACADDPTHPKNVEQLSLFTALTQALRRPLRLSFANSSGIFLGPDYHFDLARPGCALYGINPVTGENPMQNVVTLQSRILQIREAKTGETAGYGADYLFTKPALLATISLGYADGYLRSTTGHGKVALQGQLCPIVGRVSMDTIIVDVTHLQKKPGAGEMVEVIGKHLPVDNVAAAAGTIGYEILTDLGHRSQRRYIGNTTSVI